MPPHARRLDGSTGAGTSPRRGGRVALFLVALTLALAGGTSAAIAAAPAAAVNGDKIAVLPLEIIGEVPAGRPALEAAVTKGLVVTGAAVTIGPEVATLLSRAGARVACVDPGCWIAAGRALGARHLIAGVVERKAGQFQVEFRLIDAAVGQGRIVMTEANHCDVADCSVAELCRLTVNELARAGLPRAVAGSPAAAAATPPAPVVAGSAQIAPANSPGAAAAPTLGVPAGAADGTRRFPPSRPALSDEDDLKLGGLSSRARPDAAPPGRRWPSWFPVAAVVAGVAAGAVGGYLIYKDGQCIESSPCPHLYNTFWGGVATASSGALLLATGIVVGLVENRDDHPALDNGEAPPPSTVLSIGPGSISLAGKF